MPRNRNREYLTKPVRRLELRTAIVQSLSEQSAPAVNTMVIARPQPKVPAGARLNILLADDNIVNLHLARRMIEKHGHAVTTAMNGREVLSALRSQAFDMIFMDVQMPEMDGFEATAEIRRRERDGNAHIPIVAMTARAMTGDRGLCLGRNG